MNLNNFGKELTILNRLNIFMNLFHSKKAVSYLIYFVYSNCSDIFIDETSGP